MHFPGLIDCQHGQMVTVFVVELGSLLISYLLLFSRSVEHILHRQHAHDCQNLLRAPKIYRCQYHLAQLWLNWELCHQSAELRKQPFVIKRLKIVERL